MAKKIYSFLIGKWSPFTEKHKNFIREELDKGNNVCIGIMDTNITEDNPYSVKQRKKMIKKAFKGERKKGRIRMITIPIINKIISEK